MEPVMEVVAIVVGLGVGAGMGRLVLAGVLALAFRARPTVMPTAGAALTAPPTA